MVLGDAGASELDGVVQDVGRQTREVELRRGVETAGRGRHRACLEPVGADDPFRRLFDDHQMAANGVELVLVAARLVGRSESLAELEVEDLKAQREHRVELVGRLGEANRVPRIAELLRRDVADSGEERQLGECALFLKHRSWSSYRSVVGWEARRARRPRTGDRMSPSRPTYPRTADAY